MYRVKKGKRLVLASASSRRREMLTRMGLDFTTYPAQVDESPLPGEAGFRTASRLATLKARAVKKGQDADTAVLAADTLVLAGKNTLGKPQDLGEAREMLTLLSAGEHQVVTAFCLCHNGREETGSARTLVRFRELSPGEIQAYLHSDEPLDKAGAYAVQGLGAAWVEWIQGSYSNVVGLPLAAVLKLLLEEDIIEACREKTP